MVKITIKKKDSSKPTKEQQPKKKRGNPNFGKIIGFKPNDPVTGFKDPKINRSGQLKPRSQRDFEKLLDQVFDEEVALAYIGDGTEATPITRLRVLITDLLNSKDPRGKIELLARRFGKVPDKVNITGQVKVIRARIGKVEKDTESNES